MCERERREKSAPVLACLGERSFSPQCGAAMHLIGKPLVFCMSRKHFSNLFCIWVWTLPLGAVVALAAHMSSLIVK